VPRNEQKISLFCKKIQEVGVSYQLHVGIGEIFSYAVSGGFCFIAGSAPAGFCFQKTQDKIILGLEIKNYVLLPTILR
jgi:hypothetical protein